MGQSEEAEKCKHSFKEFQVRLDFSAMRKANRQAHMSGTSSLGFSSTRRHECRATFSQAGVDHIREGIMHTWGVKPVQLRDGKMDGGGATNTCRYGAEVTGGKAMARVSELILTQTQLEGVFFKVSETQCVIMNGGCAPWDCTIACAESKLPHPESYTCIQLDALKLPLPLPSTYH